MLSLGQRIRELRLKMHLTQIDLAKGLCTPSMISQIESDRARPSYHMLFSLSERLDVPLEKLLVDVDLNLEHVSTYKMARSMVRGKQYASAIPLLQELIDTPRTQIPTMDILFELGECFLHTNQLEAAETHFVQVQELAMLRQDHHLLALVLQHFGMIEFQRNRFEVARFHWKKAIEHIDKIDEQDIYLKASLLQNLGKVHIKMGRAHEAITNYDHAAALYEGTDNLGDIAHVYLGLAQSYKLAADFEKAADYSERAASLFHSLKHMLLMIKLEIDSAILHAQTGRTAEAEEALIKALNKLGTDGDVETKGIAYAELAHVYLLQGELDKAHESCQQACALLPDLHLYQAKINRTLGSLASKRRNDAEAIRRYQMAADGFKRFDELREWDDTLLLLTQIYRKQGEIEKAADLLEEALAVSFQTLSRRGIEL